MIVSGFSISISTGMRCNINRFMSDILICGTGDDMFIIGPWFVVEYRYSEYATVINLIILRGTIIHSEHLIIDMIRRISLIRLILGGAAIFAQQNRNHHIDNIGNTVSNPFVNIILRVNVKLYLIFAIQNSADDLNPWAIIIDRLACSPSLEFVSIPATISPICPTDEYAIIDFISDCRKQIIDVSTPPTIAIDIIGLINILFMCEKIMIIRAIPYPPSFSRIAAKIIDPATGASTCAFGNHKCTENSGSFTINAVIIINHVSVFIDLCGSLICSGIDIFRCFEFK